MLRTFLRAISASILVVALLVPLAASAHEEVESGSYLFEIGWMNEPVLVNQPNGLYLFITPKDTGEEHTEGGDSGGTAGEEDHHAEGVTGAEATLIFTIEYGGVTQTFDLRPVPDQPGLYTTDVLPTREGQYTFKFTGSINDEAVDLLYEPEEVETPGRIAFPEEPVSTTSLMAQLDDAKAQTSTAQTLAIVGIVLGVIGTGVGVFGMLRKK